MTTATVTPKRERLELPADRPRIRHIISPDNPRVALCGHVRSPQSRLRYWHQVSEPDICIVCLSFPGAREWAMGR